MEDAVHERQTLFALVKSNKKRCLIHLNDPNPFQVLLFLVPSNPFLQHSWMMTTNNQGCSGVGTRWNGVPTPFSRFALKRV